MKIPVAVRRLAKGELFDLQDLSPLPSRLKIGFGGYTPILQSDQQIDYNLICLALPLINASQILGQARSVMLSGAVRQTENKPSIDEWSDCWALRLDDIPDFIDCLVFCGRMRESSMQRLHHIGQIKEHFLRVTDGDTGQEILRADVAQSGAFNTFITYAKLRRKISNAGWTFEFTAQESAPLEVCAGE